jgi:hypothetical protein
VYIDCIVYLHQGAPWSFGDGEIWICEYCQNLFLHHLNYLNFIWSIKCNINVHSPKKLMPFSSSPNMRELQELIYLSLCCIIGAPMSSWLVTHKGIKKLGPSSFKWIKSTDDWPIVCNTRRMIFMYFHKGVKRKV